jgi:hypothetical protein
VSGEPSGPTVWSYMFSSALMAPAIAESSALMRPASASNAASVGPGHHVFITTRFCGGARLGLFFAGDSEKMSSAQPVTTSATRRINASLTDHERRRTLQHDEDGGSASGSSEGSTSNSASSSRSFARDGESAAFREEPDDAKRIRREV